MNTRFIKNTKNPQTISLIAISLVLFLVLFFFIGLSKNEFLQYLDDIAIIGIVSLGQMLAMIIGGIDFSMQGVYCASAIMMSHIYMDTTLSNINIPAIVIFFIILIAAMIIGALNGILISHFNINPLIMTFTTNALIEGILYAYTSGISGRSAPPVFKKFLNETILGIPVLLLIWIAITICMFIFLKKSSAGRMIIVIGKNKTASLLSGISIHKITVFSYVMSAMFASISGMLACANNGISTLTMADSITIQSLIVVLLAGASVFGGNGSPIKTIFAALTFISLEYIFKSIPIHTGIQDIIMGVILMGMIVFSGIRNLYKKGNQL